jgi:hypothetical protein
VYITKWKNTKQKVIPQNCYTSSLPHYLSCLLSLLTASLPHCLIAHSLATRQSHSLLPNCLTPHCPIVSLPLHHCLAPYFPSLWLSLLLSVILTYSLIASLAHCHVISLLIISLTHCLLPHLPTYSQLLLSHCPTVYFLTAPPSHSPYCLTAPLTKCPTFSMLSCLIDQLSHNSQLFLWLPLSH